MRSELVLELDEGGAERVPSEPLDPDDDEPLLPDPPPDPLEDEPDDVEVVRGMA